MADRAERGARQVAAPASRGSGLTRAGGRRRQPAHVVGGGIVTGCPADRRARAARRAVRSAGCRTRPLAGARRAPPIRWATTSSGGTC